MSLFNFDKWGEIFWGAFTGSPEFISDETKDFLKEERKEEDKKEDKKDKKED